MMKNIIESFEHYYHLKGENGSIFSWAQIPSSQLMTDSNPDFSADTFDVNALANSIKKYNESEDIYLFFAFNGMTRKQLLKKDGDKIESCLRICEYLVNEEED